MAEPPPESRSKRQSAPRKSADDIPEGQSFSDAVGVATEETRRLQLRLRETGFYTDAIDGLYGASTTDAVRRFQATVGLPMDGLAGPQTIERLDRLASGVGQDAEQDTTSAAPQPPAPPTTPAEAPPIVLVSSPKDAGDVARLASALTALGPRGECRTLSFEQLLDPALGALENGAVIVVCLSQPGGMEEEEPPFVLADSLPGTLVQRAAAGDLRIVPLLLDPVDIASTGLASYQALDAVPFRTADNPDEWLRDAARELADLAWPGRPASYLPRFSADDLEGKELLERREKIEFIASVLAAKQLETPLAIGLFGDWGSGKSFFMERLQKRIVTLTEASAAVANDGGRSLYCSHVRHVNFNAWLHSGAPDLWPAFAAEVFRGIADPETRDEQGKTQRRDLIGFQEQLAEAEERKERIRELEREVSERRNALHGLEPDAGGAGKFVGTLREIGARLVGLRHGWRDLQAADILLVVSIGLAIAAFALFQTPLAWVAAGATALLAVLRYLDESRRLHRLEAELANERGKQAKYERGAAVEVPPELLPDFARREAADWAQRAQFDSVTEIRMKFNRLSDLIKQGLAAQADSGASTADALPIERVIVYVDDLDRCQHGVVVSVLETLKLLLSLPHFVAVVGVDSRWLFRSLELHFRELLHTDDGAAQDAAWAATPQNYLEKIFQYSVVLKPITEAGFANLIESLLATPEPQGQPAALPPSHGAAPAGSPPQGGDTPTEAGKAPTGGSTVGVTAQGEPEPVDLTPVELVITPEEIEFIQGLAPLFETPRAAKRLANVYRLMRVSVGADRLTRDEGYEPALLLLAIGIGFPGLAGELFDAIRSQPSTSWPDFVQGLPAADDAHRKLKSRLGRASPGAVADRNLASFAPWIEEVAEFSFHPWQELLPATATS